MGAMISRQPNGKYCRYSTVIDNFTHINMTAEQYIEYCRERAAEEAQDVLDRHLIPFARIENEVKENPVIPNDILDKMRQPDGQYEEP